MATTRKTKTEKMDLPALGEEGDACFECGAALAVDQRYCLNCGDRRAGPRLDFERMLPGTGGGGTAGAANMPAAPMMAIAPRSEWSPLVAVGCIAVLGGMLLLGVLIGKDDNPSTVAAAPATTAAPVAAATPAPTASTPAATPAATAAKGKVGAGPDAAVAGGSGDTSGIPAADTTVKTGKDASDASKNSPDQVATSGAPAKQDPTGQAGDGSSATVIGGN